MRMYESKALQALTNKFIKDFLDLAQAEKEQEKATSKHPQLVSDKRHDSLEFNHSLPAYIAQSDYVQTELHDGDHPLIGSGFVSNVAKEFFKMRIQGYAMDIMYIIANIDKQPKYEDYKVKNLQVTSIIKTVKEINADSFFDKTQPFQKDVDKVFTTKSFELTNNRSGYEGRCEVKLEDGELEEILIYKGNAKQVIIRYRKGYSEGASYEEPQLEHFKYVADVNSFFMVIDQVYYFIKEAINGKSDEEE